ncbi:hypothetical protein FOMPIDRAFT_91405 [Fomitopsis schrenkii]|uniref:Uncharacterized protein n=1 Tax=Fomitopsis schrenkii TaxID=2126942 RepID=S8FA31_FOMSC|nr:hypothetical protein FOMPIDRAFT_91405 [Fomitopsis schrenkii]
MAEKDVHIARFPPGATSQVAQDGITRQVTVRVLEGRPALFAHISRLPPELLCQIFIQAATCPADSVRSDWPGRPNGWIWISQVCRQWCAMVLGCPALWNRIHVTLNPDWMAALFKRSKEVPLTVSIGPPAVRITPSSVLSIPDRVEGLLLLHSHRVRVLEVSAPRRIEGEMFRAAVKGRMPLLESLAIDCHHTGVIDIIQESVEYLLYESNPLNLRFLNLNQVHFDWPRLSVPSLTCLHLRDCRSLGALPTLHDFLIALAHMPLLQQLVLWYGVASEDSHAGRDIHVALPHLQSLEVTGSPPVCAALLQHLDTPALKHLAVNPRSPHTAVPSPVDLFEAMGSRTRLMGHPCTLFLRITPGTGRRDGAAGTEVLHSCKIKAYREAINAKTINSPLKDLRERPFMYCVSFSWPASEDPFTSFCQHSFLDKVHTLILWARRGELNPESWWRPIVYATVELEQLILSADEQAHVFSLDPMLLPHDFNTRHESSVTRYPLPHLRCLTLDSVDFRHGIPRGILPHWNYAEHVEDCFMIRYDAGVEIETLRIQRAANLETSELERLRQSIRFVEVEGE